MGYINHKDYTIIKKHFLMLLYHITKFVFRWIITVVLIFSAVYFREKIWEDYLNLLFFPLLLIFILYSFVSLVLWLIEYYNDLVIFLHDKIIIINSTFYLKDDLEIIDVSKIMKIDIACHWFFANFLGYWNLIIEQQRDELFTLRFIPNPYRALELFREKTSYIHTWDDLSFFKLK